MPEAKLHLCASRRSMPLNVWGHNDSSPRAMREDNQAWLFDI
jgi:hypothetical protein